MATIKLEGELAYALYVGEQDDCYEVVAINFDSEWRWGVNYEMVVKDLATGKYFAAICQEQIGDNYYNSFEDGPVEFFEVTPVEVTITKYKRVNA